MRYVEYNHIVTDKESQLNFTYESLSEAVEHIEGAIGPIPATLGSLQKALIFSGRVEPCEGWLIERVVREKSC